MKKKGTFTGVGTGPGDPELMTLKAVRTIENADVLLLPAADKESCRAYKTAYGACPEIADKKCIFEPFPMTMNKNELSAFHERVADRVIKLLAEGLDVVFPVIGDPCIYSTYDYIERIVKRRGYETKRVSGIPSFIASAGRLDMSLGDDGRPVHIIPGSLDIEKALKLDGTVVFMKTGKDNIGRLRQALKDHEKAGGRSAGVYACSLPEEEVVYKASDIPDDWGYLNVVIADRAEDK